MNSRRAKWLVGGLITALLLTSIGISQYQSMLRTSREKVLAENLGSIREVIAQYTKDRQSPPQSLQQLVDAGYYRKLPVDPLTHSNSTWEPITGRVAVFQGKTEAGISDVRSGSAATSSKGTLYNSW